MDIFSNMTFWIILIAIIFILALIGYLSESMKKPKEEKKNHDDTASMDSATTTNNTLNMNNTMVADNNLNVNNSAMASDNMTMPEVNVEKLDTDNQHVLESPVTDNLPGNMDTANNGVVEPLVNEPTDTVASVNVNDNVTPVDLNNANPQATTDNEKNNNIWNG